jgi:hypothetical protein
MLIERISKIKNDAILSVFYYDKLKLIGFESFDSKIYLPILINDFKYIKDYLRKVKYTDDIYFSEFIYHLEFLKYKIIEINTTLKIKNNYTEYDNYFDEYKEYLEDITSSKKNIINDYLIRYIARYTKFCLLHRKKEFIKYQKKLNTEILKNALTKLKLKKRKCFLTESIEKIVNELNFGNGNNIVFNQYDQHNFSNGFNFSTLLEKKEVFESELKLLDFEKNEIINFELIKTEPINEIEPQQKIPYKIALLHELGFFKLDAIKKLTKENQFKIISSLTGGTHRTVKGNVNVLDANSDENRLKYTSNNHIDEVKIYLNKLK